MRCAAIEAATVLSNLVAGISEHEAVAAAHWLCAGQPGPPMAEIQSRLMDLREALGRTLTHEPR